MANQNQQDREPGKLEMPDQVSPPLSFGASRRRFTKGGLGVSGVILTLASRPGMACDISTSPSGSLSGGLQSHHGPAPTCSGVSPGYWKNHAGWPTPLKTTTRFGSLFSCNGSHQNYKNTTLITMLSHQSFDADNLGMHLVASCLNAQSGRTSFLTLAMLQTMWKEWQANGYYMPIAGVKWYAYDIVKYLKGTMD